MEQRYTLHLLGAFRLIGPDGARIDIRSKRSRAMLAMLALTDSGERSRVWLQDMLWCAREPSQANASLRREISTLKKLINCNGTEALRADRNSVVLDVTCLDIDAHSPPNNAGQLLEGLDITGEDAFEGWLRQERQRLEQNATEIALGRESASASSAMAASPSSSLGGHTPSLAVLRFVVEPTTENGSNIADTVADDLISRLARMRWLPVLSPSSSFTIMSGERDLRSVGKVLGVQYVLEGKLAQCGDRLELRASLSETHGGHNLKTQQVTWHQNESGEALDMLILTLASALGRTIDHNEQRRASRCAPEPHNVAQLIWRGRWHLNHLTKANNTAARACFEEALAIRPTSQEALIQLCWLDLRELWMTRGDPRQIPKIRRTAQKVILADPEDARGHALAGIAEMFLRQPIRAEALFVRALEHNPSLVMARASLGSVLSLQGKFAEALEQLNLAVSLSPNDPDMFHILGELAVARLFLGEGRQCLELAEQSLALRSGYWLAHLSRIGAYISIQDQTRARTALSELLTAKPKFTPDYIDWLPFIDARHNDCLKEILNQAAL